MDIEALRREFKHDELKEENLNPDAIKQFEKWFEQAVHADILDVNAMTLATATKDGHPSARIVLLKGFDEAGFTFFTNYQSKKGQELAENPKAALLIYWKELDRQVRIVGEVIKTSAADSDTYFNSRSMESRISAAISPQSQVVESRRWLEEQWVQYLKKIENEDFQRPLHWGGFLLQPKSIEFWQGRPNRLHDRIRYTRSNHDWLIERLAP
ncbi:MAG TPA: pyridoxamine 5'-phosphate oxidase [Bacteroidales bacterium]|nr:pyridoxamine 5'-phosphate oxidase [Bacteroidales bacterium]HRX96003.1 pyridoxamine 5'-phosphate oxidase [Bacteroidales bacterium]